MPMTLKRLRERVPRLERWAIAAILIAVGIALYYGILGTRYWVASEDLSTANDKNDELEQAIGVPIPDEEALKEELNEREERLEEWKRLFSYEGYQKWADLYRFEGQEETDLLLAIVTAKAKEAGVRLSRVSVLEPGTETDGDLEFQTQSLRLELQGDTHRQIYDFLSGLYKSVPIVGIPNIILSGFGGAPAAKVDLSFYLLAPEPDAEEEKAE